MKIFRKLYEWGLEQAKTEHAERFLFFLAVAESSFFPLPPDVVLIAMVLASREKWIKYFLICLSGSVLGGLLGYAIGFYFWQAASPFFFNYVFSEELFNRVQTLYQQHDFWIVFAAGFTPIPYKVFTITAGVASISVVNFFVASLFGRGGRFFLVAVLLRIFGQPIRLFIEKYFNLLTIIFTILLIGGFAAIKLFLH